MRYPKLLFGIQTNFENVDFLSPYQDQHPKNKNARNISNNVLSTEKSKWENLGSFIESKMSINKSGASRPRRRSTFWQGIEWDTPIKFKTIDLYKALISSSSLMCEKRRQSYFILHHHMEEKIEGTNTMRIFLNLLFYG